MLNFEQTVASQYFNSPTLMQLVTNMNGYIDPTANLDAFYGAMWNVLTAQGYGLDVWGRIVGVNRVIFVAGSAVYLGFEQASGAQPFDQAPFYDALVSPGLVSNFALTDDAFRQLILAKALFNICNGSIQAINQILINLFGSIGNCYVTDGQNMTMAYSFAPTLTPVQFAIVSQSGVLPKPAGVSATVVQR